MSLTAWLSGLETSNNIYGYTSNPFNRDLSPGGSSGGEGALIACRGSLMGIGTDIGGSIVSHLEFNSAVRRERNSCILSVYPPHFGIDH